MARIAKAFLRLLAGAALGAVVYFTGVPGLFVSNLSLRERQYALRNQINNMRRENNALEVMRSKKEEFSLRVQLLQEQLDAVRKIVPDDAEDGMLAQTFSRLAVASGCRLQTVVPTSPVGHEFFTALPFIVKVRGPYPGLANFYLKLETQDRLISVPALTLEPAGPSTGPGLGPDRSATGTFVVNAYFIKGRGPAGR